MAHQQMKRLPSPVVPAHVDTVHNGVAHWRDRSERGSFSRITTFCAVGDRMTKWDDPLATGSTLLNVLRNPNDDASWNRFVARYKPLVISWAKRNGCQESDADNMCQETLLRVWKALPGFDYDHGRRFRSWLKTVLSNAIRDEIRIQKRYRNQLQVDDSEDEQTDGQSIEQFGSLDQVFDQVADREILEIAFEVVSKRKGVSDDNIRACRLLLFEKLTNDEVCQRLGLQPGVLASAKKRFIAAMRQEISRLSDDEP